MTRKIELLSPAKSCEHGIEAINHGADAVYIGAPMFSARANAGNSIQEIERLIHHAHQYYAKVYVALNTILTDQELGEAENIIHQLYDAGTDALIVQDMGITQLDLPPIPLHASTQMDNRTLEKVQFLENAGFEQVVLARELSIDQIREIHKNSNVRLEAFVHGALCVCYSGQCYLSEYLCGRSANRGTCAQLCRLPYSLKDADGNVLVKEKHLLSLKDFNLSDHLSELIDAGISSLKIEGRLKDIQYVKNVTAYYRQLLDRILCGDVQPASSGHCTYTFQPNIEKSFHRGSTDYFLHGRNPDITSFDTSKSLGETIGKVKKCNGKEILIETNEKLSNGDGFCYLNESGEFRGFKANLASGNQITPAEKIFILPGTLLFRNFDQQFENLLAKKSADRKINASFLVTENADGILFQLTDEDGNQVRQTLSGEKVAANNEEKQKENMIRILQKCGDTLFFISMCEIQLTPICFIPAATLTHIRRSLTDLLMVERERNRSRCSVVFPETSHRYPMNVLDYRGNVHNQKAKVFYKKHGVDVIDDSYEKKHAEHAELMRCKHCIRYSLGYCTRTFTGKLRTPLTLENSAGKAVQLSFDCKNCEMTLIATK